MTRPEEDRAEFEIVCGGDYSATSEGPRKAAWKDALHYAAQYSNDGPVEIYEVTRKKVWPE